MQHRRIFQVILVFLLLFGLAACQAAGEEEAPTQEVVVVVVTATEPPAEEVAEGEDTGPVEVVTIQDINMRAGDSTAYGVMTVIPGNTSVQVTGKNGDGSWYQVFYHDATGWISAAYTEGEVPEDLAIVQPPPVPQSSGSGGGGGSPTNTPSSGGGGGGGGGGGDGDGDGDGGGGGGAPSDSDISVDVNIKNHTSSHNGEISYPNGDTTDRVFVHIVGFDSVTTSGEAQFTLACSGDGVGNVSVTGGGSCNDTWTKFFTNDSDNLTITIKLDSGSNAYVEWTLIISADN